MTVRSFFLSCSRYPTSWLATNTPRTTRVLAISIGVVVFVLIGLVDWFMYNARFRPYRVMLGSDAIAAILVALVTYKLLQNSRKRRALVRRYLEIIAESNHHIRNALELIQFSAQTTHDQKITEQISMGIDRIEWVLRELLGNKGLEEASETTSPSSPSSMVHSDQRGDFPTPS